MGLTYVPVTVSNFITNQSFTAKFLIDTGASEPMIPADELRKIGIEPTGKRVYEMANRHHAEFEVGEARLSFCEETFPIRVIFGPDGCEPILGVIALEAAGFIIDPSNQTLTKLKVFPLKKVAAAIAAT